MGWKEEPILDQRMRFVLACESSMESFSYLCRCFSISRKTGYKWLGRYHAYGPEGLMDLSRAPWRRPGGLSAELAARCLGVRHAHPRWGPRKIRAWLKRSEPSIAWPAASTIGHLLDRHGLTVKRQRRHRSPPMSAPFLSCDQANSVWCMDFKGWFRTGDGARCEPFTLCDAYSRYLLRCQPLTRNDGRHVWAVLDAAFREFGLPLALRSDNGPPFASIGAGGLSKVSVQVLKAGVLPERIEPGKPQQNGRLERFHLTLLQDTASPPAPSIVQQCDRFQQYQREYNEERPHQALDDETPAMHFQLSPRRWDGVLRSPEYPSDVTVRRVRPNGEITLHGSSIYISQTLAGEPVCLEEKDHGKLHVRYGPIHLGTIAAKENRLRRPKTKARINAHGLVDNLKGLPTTPQAQQ